MPTAQQRAWGIKMPWPKSKPSWANSDIMESVMVDPNSGCWLWLKCVNTSNGYGRVCWRGKASYAHRASYERHFGEIPPGINVLHKCDTPACIRPDHLFLGTQQDNVDDMVAKGRQVKPEQQSRALRRLPDSLILEIYHSKEDGIKTARKYGVCTSTIYGIRNGKRNRFLTEGSEL